jgi:hypothetical protein
MKPLDWLLLALSLPFVMLHVIQFTFMILNASKIRSITIGPAFFIPYLMIMLVLYRVWG